MSTWRSKLGNVFSRTEIERSDKEHHVILKNLRKQPANARCAECGSGDTNWASVNLGVFLCVRCADVHRALGTHISKPKGCGGTYLWGPDEIAQMQNVGNSKAMSIYCSAVGCPKMTPDSSKEELMDFCQKKYELRLWAWSGDEVGQSTARSINSSARPASEKPLAKQLAHAASTESAQEIQPCDSRQPDLLAPCALTTNAPRSCQSMKKPDFDVDSFFASFDQVLGEVAPQKAQAALVTLEFDDLLGAKVLEAPSCFSEKAKPVTHWEPVPAATLLQRHATTESEKAELWHDFGAW